MSLDAQQVAKIANLARLKLSQDELAVMTEQLGKIVEFVGHLSELDTQGVEPMVHAIEIENVLAEDVIKPSLPRSAVLAGAPSSDAECFRVPPVL